MCKDRVNITATLLYAVANVINYMAELLKISVYITHQVRRDSVVILMPFCLEPLAKYVLVNLTATDRLTK